MEKQLNTRYLLICTFLVISTLVVYWQVKDHAFINLDDNQYITENIHVQCGLTYDGMKWALTAFHATNWHPVTWLSHMLDIQFFGFKPGAHHLVNLFFHVINTLLLFTVLNRMTHALWKSAFVAALFALHPLHVESVAWVAERKDVLSTFFWMLTMVAYILYAEKPNFKRYLATLTFFILGLMAKPMLVTLPFALLLLDYWPLNRFQYQKAEKNDSLKSTKAENFKRRKGKYNKVPVKEKAADNQPQKSNYSWAVTRNLLREKIPFFIFSTLSSIVTVHAQQEATPSLQMLPFADRIGNALISYIQYIEKMFWPRDLAVFYPHPGLPSLWAILIAAALLLGITAIILWQGRRFRYLMVGWFWYLGTLVPVIGLVQAGDQSMADRYTYIPLIGIFIIAAWGIPELLKKWRHQKIVLTLSSSLIIIVLIPTAYKQVSYWKNSITLFQHCLVVTHNNYIAHERLGNALADIGKTEEAIVHYRESIKIKPGFVNTHNNLGVELARQGKTDEAITYFRNVLLMKPNDVDAHYNLGNELLRQGKIDEAITHFITALQLSPNNSSIYINFGAALAIKGKTDEAISYLNKAIQLKPNEAKAHGMLARILFMQGKSDQAADQFREALRLNPEDNTAKRYLNRIMAESKERGR
jgi:tetratricopeptide (TPR) repeat protein